MALEAMVGHPDDASGNLVHVDVVVERHLV